jgi:hypothetical protein
MKPLAAVGMATILAGLLLWWGFTEPGPKRPVHSLASSSVKGLGEEVHSNHQRSLQQPEAPAATPLFGEEEDRQQKIAKLKALMEQLRAYEALVNRLFEQHPELREIHPLIAWLHRLSDTEYPGARAEWQAAVAKSPKDGETLLKVMHLMRPQVMLAMMDDPKFGSLTRDVWETVGLRHQVDGDLAVLDEMAGFDGPGQHTATSSDEFRRLLSAREAACNRAAQRLAQTLPNPISDELRGFMAAEMQKEVLVPYLKAYYDSFIADDALAVAQSIKTQQREVQRMLISGGVPPALVKEYDALLRRIPPLPAR